MANPTSKTYISDEYIRDVIVRCMGISWCPITMLEDRLWNRYKKENGGKVWFKDESKDWFLENRIELAKRRTVIIRELKGYIVEKLKEIKMQEFTQDQLKCISFFYLHQL